MQINARKRQIMGWITAMHGNIIYCSDMFCFDMFCWWQHVVDIIISLFHNCSPVLSNPCNTNICPKLPMTWVIHPAPWGLNINRFKFESAASMVGLYNLVYHIIQFIGLIWGSIETRNHFCWQCISLTPVSGCSWQMQKK